MMATFLFIMLVALYQYRQSNAFFLSMSSTNNNIKRRLSSVVQDPIHNMMLEGKSKSLGTESVWNNLRERKCPKQCEMQVKTIDIDQIKSWFLSGKLELFPEYQREYVWEESRASRLIVTILENRMVPAFVLREKEGGGCFEAVDGKQRLSSILSFYFANSNPEYLRRHRLVLCYTLLDYFITPLQCFNSYLSL